MDPKKLKLLSSDLLTAGEIYQATRIEKTPIYFNALVERLSKAPKKLSRGALSRALERLSDLKIIKAEWMQKENKNWVRSIVIRGESEDFVKDIYEKFFE